MKTVGKWLYIIGLLVAGLVGMFAFSNLWVSLLLMVVGILAAIFYLDSADLVNAGIRFLVLFAAKDAFTAIPAVGPYLGGFFNGVFAFLVPVMLTLLIIHFVQKYFMAK